MYTYKFLNNKNGFRIKKKLLIQIYASIEDTEVEKDPFYVVFEITIESVTEGQKH